MDSGREITREVAGFCRRIFAVLSASLALLWFVSCSFGGSAPYSYRQIVVDAVSVELDSKHPSRREVGKLLFMSGFVLKSSDRRFGGLSGLWVSEDGSALLAVSDRGYWLSAQMQHDSAGRLIGLNDWKVEPLLATQRTAPSGKLTDAEALTQDRDGSFIVSFEQVHRLWRYAPLPATLPSMPVPIPVPAELARAPANGGIECVAVDLEGRMIALTEELRRMDGSFAGWIIDKDRFDAFSYTASEDFVPSDCAMLKNGDLLVLERRLGFLGRLEARIKRVARSSIRAEAILEGTEIAHLRPPLTVDNFEGIAVFEHPAKGTFVYIVSDDNYFPLQRTLLLQFRLL